MASSTSSLILHSPNNRNFLLRRPSAAGSARWRSVGEARATANNDRPPSTSSSSSSNGWWTTIFGWPSEPDYIDGPGESGDSRGKEEGNRPKNNASSRFLRGCFTEEKAKQLRMKTMEGSTFHDVMYHSAIASRLASRFPDRGSTDSSGASTDL